METLKLDKIAPSKTNPRKHFDPKALEELAMSVKTHGVLQPILVRSLNGNGSYELVSGERRYKAAKQAGLIEIPALVLKLDDKQVLEIQVIENLQRSDLHAMEEADGYRQLMRAGYDVAKIADRVGRSVKYVYDRVKLLNLIPALSKVFLEDKVTAGHAILLARLSPDDQKRSNNEGALWQYEHGRGLFDEEESDEPHYKPSSVRELQAWINENVRFDKQVVDHMLFPDTAEVLQTSAQDKEKIVQITHDHYVRPDARDPKERIISPRSWKRADGSAKDAKSCDHAVTGVIVVGPGRGEAFKVCIEKKKCAIHWKAEQRESVQRAKRMATGDGNAQERYKKEEERRKAEEAKREVQRAAWKKSTPAILKALAERLTALPAKPTGVLADLILSACNERGVRRDVVDPYVKRGKTLEDLIQYAAFVFLMPEVLNEWRAPFEFPKLAKSFGLDVQKILDQNASR
jgi:ParB/RepB/Spo0J family partition protein